MTIAERNATGELPFIFEDQYDAQSGVAQTFSINGRARSIVLRFDPEPSGAAPTGAVNVYVNGNIGGPPWQTITPGNVPICRPFAGMPIGSIITLIPVAGSTGIVTVTATEESQGVR
jgi:hypothetical protein